MVRCSTLKPCNWGTYPLIVGLKTYQIILWEFKKKIVSPDEVAKSPHSSANQQKSDRFRQRSGKAWSMNQSFWYNWWRRWYWIGMIYCGGGNPKILNKRDGKVNKWRLSNVDLLWLETIKGAPVRAGALILWSKLHDESSLFLRSLIRIVIIAISSP